MYIRDNMSKFKKNEEKCIKMYLENEMLKNKNYNKY